MASSSAEQGSPGLRGEPDALARIAAFWAGKSGGDRPALSIRYRHPEPPPVTGPMPGPTLEQGLAELGAHRAWAQAELTRRISLAEDIPRIRVPGADLTIFALLCGGTVREDRGHAWVAPLPGVLEQPVPVFDPEHPVIRAWSASMEALAGLCPPEAYLDIPYNGVDPLTLLSLFMGADELAMVLLEEPEVVQPWLDAAARVYLDYHAYMTGLIRRLGFRQEGAWYRLTAPGSFEAAQCDFGVMISPAMFDRFALPFLRSATDRADYSLYHLDGIEQLRFLDQLAELPGLNGIQWNPQPGEKDVRKWIDTFRQIRERGWLLLFNEYDIDVEQAVILHRELGPDGLWLSLPVFDSRGDAEAALLAIERA
jgi:hypothetical protein